MQQEIINTQRTAVPQCFTGIWLCLQSEATDLNLGLEQEVRFQNSKINPQKEGSKTRISSLWYSLRADGSTESVLLSKPRFVCSPEVLQPASQLPGGSHSSGALSQLLLPWHWPRGLGSQGMTKL